MARPRPAPIDRRTFLRGAGAFISLPWLEAMMPQSAFAQSTFPKRVAVFCFPFGTHNQAWAPSSYGTLNSLPANLNPISGFRSRVVLTRGLGAHGLPQGSHMAATPYFLTEPLDNCQFGVREKSADMIIADYVSQSKPTIRPLITRPSYSLEFRQCWPHDRWNYDAAMCPFMSWSTATTPASQVRSPGVVFDNLFAGNNNGSGPAPANDPLVAFRRARGLSVLDDVLSQANSYINKVGAADKATLDQYFTSIREVERTINATPAEPPPPVNNCTTPSRPGDNLPHDQTTKAFIDLAVLAMACDKTRVVSHVLDTESEHNRVFPWIGITDTRVGHHLISHTNDNSDGLAAGDKPPQYLKITEWYASQLNYLLTRMASYKEGDRDLLYNSVVVYGSGMGPTGGAHASYDLSLVIAGELGGTIRTGRALNCAGTRMANMWLTIIQKYGITKNSYASSTGTIDL